MKHGDPESKTNYFCLSPKLIDYSCDSEEQRKRCDLWTEQSFKKFWIPRYGQTQNISVFFATTKQTCRVELKAWNRIRKFPKNDWLYTVQLSAGYSFTDQTVHTYKTYGEIDKESSHMLGEHGGGGVNSWHK